MIEIFSLVASIILFALLLAFLPFRLTGKGKLAVLVCSIISSSVLFMGSTVLGFWYFFPIAILLVALMSFLVVRRVHIFNTVEGNLRKNNEKVMDPFFSFVELKENADNAETIDPYYMDVRPITRNESSSVMGQAEIDKLLHQRQEVAVSVEEVEDAEINPLSIPLMNENNEMELTEYDLPLDKADRIELISDQLPTGDGFYPELNNQEERSVLINSVPMAEEQEQAEFVSREFLIDKMEDEFNFTENSDRTMEHIELEDEDFNLSEIRKKLFSELEGASIEKVGLNLKEEPTKSETNIYSSQQLTDAFDDLEEYYKRKKADMKDGEEQN